jgi:tetratricopeptide (TPR) repeat protein
MPIIARAFALVLLGAAVCQAADVHVSGSYNVGIAQMQGGSIQLGLTPQEARDIARASGAGLVNNLMAVIQRNVAQQLGEAQRSTFSYGVVEGFLAALTGKKVPQSDWPRVLGELASEFLTLRERIKATPVTSDEIKDLVARADTASRQGHLDEADRWLDEASNRALEEARKSRERARAASEQVARLLASRGSLALTQLDRSKGARLLERAFSEVEDAPTPETLDWLIDAGKAWLTAGQSGEALRTLTLASSVASRRAEAEPSRALWQRALGISEVDIGAASLARGDLGGALADFEAARAAFQKLTASEPSDPRWQHDLSLSEILIGTILSAQGKLAQALASYQASLAITRKLTEADPSNTLWRRDLSYNLATTGDLLAALGKREVALTDYEAALTILEDLAAREPPSTWLQNDLAVSQDKIGDTLSALGKREQALASYQASLDIRQQLAAADPSNMLWELDVSVSLSKIGDILGVQGRREDALKSYQASLAAGRSSRTRIHRAPNGSLPSARARTGSATCRPLWVSGGRRSQVTGHPLP